MKRPNKDTAAGARKLNRRTLIIGGAQAGFMGLLALRMRYMQVEEADKFRLLAEENRVNIRLIPPARGEIFDRNGAAIAVNNPAYRITLTREDAGDVDTIMQRLGSLLSLNDEEMERVTTELKRTQPFFPVTVADQVQWSDVTQIAVNAPISIHASKQTIAQVLKDESGRDMQLLADISRKAADSNDFTEGRVAFMEKRPAVFTGT